MNRAKYLRRVFWIGWVVWFFVVLVLLRRLPFGDWTSEGSTLYVTWYFLLWWAILFWAWLVIPVILRPLDTVRLLERIAKGLINAPKQLLNAIRNNPLFFITWAVLLVGWQVASYLVPILVPGNFEHPLVPGWEYVFSESLFRISGGWHLPGGFPLGGWTLPDWLSFTLPDWLGGFTLRNLPGITFDVESLAPFAAEEGAASRSWTAVFLALGFHSFQTLLRLVLGLALGLAAGLATGLAIPYWPALRQTSWVPFNFLRMIPLLAAIPWAQFALGVDLRATTLFIGFGVWVTLVVATMNSVANVPDRYIESARTLGASRPYTYFKVIIPGSMPELRTALLLSAGLSWSLTIAAEFLGFTTGLGHMANAAVDEANTGRLLIVAVVVAFYSLLTFYFLNQGFNKLVSWMPQQAGQTDISKVAGAAGAARVEASGQQGS